VSRQSTPERIEAAHREATRHRLMSSGLLPERVDALMAAWEADAERRGLLEGRRYAGEDGWEWTTAERSRSR
jgi:hypothetical protein